MTTSSHPGRPGTPPPSRAPWFVLGGIVVVVLVVVVVAFAMGSSSDDDDATTATAGGDPGTTAEAAPSPVAEDTPATVDGTPLAALPDGGDDPAVGQQMPRLEGLGIDGEPVTIPAPGQPTMIMFVAHWCPHCQAEVPVVQDWVDGGGLPEGVQLMSVSTAVDDRRPNYPPSAWLTGEGWTAPVLIDGDGSAAAASGLTAYPFFVAVDAEGRVVLRTSGELTTAQLDAVAGELAGPAS